MAHDDRPSAELVQLYDAAGRPGGTADRASVRSENHLHAATAVVVRDRWGRVHVHRRTESKDLYPGRCDFAAGGVVGAGEDPAEAAVRELAEELGVTGVALEPLGVSRYTDDSTDYWGHCFTVTWDGDVALQAEEIAWGDWWPVDRLVAALAAEPERWMPDTVGLLGDWLASLAVDRQQVAAQGWDCHAEIVEGRWLDRTPRRPEVVPGLLAETGLMPRLAPRLPLDVPVPVVIGTDPLRVRHRLVPGHPVVADRLTAEDGRRVGAFLRALHDSPAATWEGTGVPADTDRIPQLEAMAAQVVPMLPADLRPPGRDLVQRCVEAIRSHSTLRHGDLGPAHLLTTADRVSGVIDWADAALGDPGLDLAWLLHATPTAFADALVAAYRPSAAELARGRDWHRLGPWWEVHHGLTGGGQDHVRSGLEGVVERLRATP